MDVEVDTSAEMIVWATEVDETDQGQTIEMILAVDIEDVDHLLTPIDRQEIEVLVLIVIEIAIVLDLLINTNQAQDEIDHLRAKSKLQIHIRTRMEVVKNVEWKSRSSVNIDETVLFQTRVYILEGHSTKKESIRFVFVFLKLLLMFVQNRSL